MKVSDAAVFGWLLIAEYSCTTASSPTAMFPEPRSTFPLLRHPQTNVENVCLAEGRCLWKKRQTVGITSSLKGQAD